MDLNLKVVKTVSRSYAGRSAMTADILLWTAPDLGKDQSQPGLLVYVTLD